MDSFHRVQVGYLSVQPGYLHVHVVFGVERADLGICLVGFDCQIRLRYGKADLPLVASKLLA